MRRSDGVRTLADIRARCFVDDHGCWIWKFATDDGCPKVHVGASAIPGLKRGVHSARRVSWLLAGKRNPSGFHVYVGCTEGLCVNPAHLKLGTAGDQARAAMARSGVCHSASRRVQLANARACQLTPIEVVRQVEADISAGIKRRDIAAARGLNYSTVCKIGQGKHHHQRAPGVANSSVFNLARSLGEAA
jgi:hypothetical protein